MNTNIIIAFINGVLVAVGIILLNGIIARGFGIDALGEFLYHRRIIVSIIGITLIGMNIGVPFYIPRGNGLYVKSASIAIFMVITIPLLVLVIVVLQNIFSNRIISINPIVLFIYAIGVNMQSLLYAINRGHLKILKASLIQIGCVVIIPILISFIVKDVALLLLYTGIASCVVCALMVIRYLKYVFNPTTFKYIKQLMKYGSSRVIGFIGQSVLLAGLPLLAVTKISFSEMAYLNSCFSILRMILMFIIPIGLVLLPTISRSITINEHSRVKFIIEALLAWTVFISVVIGFILYLYGPELIQIWLHGGQMEEIRKISLIFLAVPFYAIVGILRSPIDGLSKKGFNSIVYMLGATTMVVVWFILTSINVDMLASLVTSYLTGYFIAALTSIIVVKRIINIFMIPRNLLLHIILYLIVIYITTSIIEVFSSNVLINICLVSTLSMIYVAIMIRIDNSHWIKLLRRKLPMYSCNE